MRCRHTRTTSCSVHCCQKASSLTGTINMRLAGIRVGVCDQGMEELCIWGGVLSRARLQLACPEIHPKGKSTRGSSRGLTMLLTGPQHRSEVVWALALYLIEWGPCRPKCVVAAWRVQHLRENLGSRRLSARHAFDTALKLLLDHPGISSRQSSIDGTIPGKQL